MREERKVAVRSKVKGRAWGREACEMKVLVVGGGVLVSAATTSARMFLEECW